MGKFPISYGLIVAGALTSSKRIGLMGAIYYYDGRP
jgi:hypothetical protein